MADPINVDIILFKDGEDFFLQSRSSQPVRVRLAFVDTAKEADGQGRIEAILPEPATEAHFSEFLDETKALVEDFVQSGKLDLTRENIRLRKQIAGMVPANAV